MVPRVRRSSGWSARCRRAGDFDKDQLFEVDEDQTQKYSNRNKTARQDKIETTLLLRATLQAASDITPAVKAA